MQRIQGYILLITLSVIWGVAFVAIRRATFELSPVNLTLLRWLIAGGSFLALSPFLGKGRAKFDRNDLPRLIVVAIFEVDIYHLSLNYSETLVSSGLAGLLVSLGPVFIVALSSIFLREKVGSRLLAALVSALVGATILTVGSGYIGFKELSGPLAAMLSALAYAVYVVSAKPLVSKYGPTWVATWAAVMGTGLLLPVLSGSFVAQVSSLSAEGWSSVLFLAILSTVVGYLLLYSLLSTRAVSSLSIQLYLIPVVSVVGGALLLGEAVTILTIGGGALMLLAVGLATNR